MPKTFIITLAVFEALLILVHLAVYATLSAAFGIGGAWWEALFVALAFTFVSASVLARYFSHRAVAWYYAFSAYWFGLVHFLFGGGVVVLAAMARSYAFGWYTPLALLGAVCFGAAFLIHSYATWNSGRAEITRIAVRIPGLPAEWQGRKVAFVSDVHLGNVRSAAFAAKVARKIAALAPWALLIGGDLYDGTRCNEEAMIEPWRMLIPQLPGGSYFVTGNHEYYLRNGEIGQAIAAIKGIGIRVLDNETIDLDGVQLVGVDDKSVAGQGSFPRVLGGIPHDPSVPSILLRHIPLDLEVPAKEGFSLVLSGHTHQGQIFPLNLLTRRIYRGYDYGLKPYGAMQVYTSSGVGTWGPPLRLGTNRRSC